MFAMKLAGRCCSIPACICWGCWWYTIRVLLLTGYYRTWGYSVYYVSSNYCLRFSFLHLPSPPLSLSLSLSPSLPLFLYFTSPSSVMHTHLFYGYTRFKKKKCQHTDFKTLQCIQNFTAELISCRE